MDLLVNRVDVWAASTKDRPGALSGILRGLYEARADGPGVEVGCHGGKLNLAPRPAQRAFSPNISSNTLTASSPVQ